MSEQPNRPEQPRPMKPTPPAKPAKPAGGSSRPAANVDTAKLMKQVGDAYSRLKIDRNIALKVLLVAVISGILAALIDRILDLPTTALIFTLGWFIAVLNGPLYAFFKGKDDLAGVVMAAVAGFVALLAWFIITKLIGDRDLGYNITYNPADAYNLLKVLLDGVLLGLLGFGWFAGLRRLPAKFLP
jgi:uncharacterized membrane protein YvlD (DUF360 family)